jgi:hypothetical protein
MNPVVFGLLAGDVFGSVAVGSMLPMQTQSSPRRRGQSSVLGSSGVRSWVGLRAGMSPNASIER